MTICKSLNGASGNGMRGMWEMGVGMKTTWRMGVEMWGLQGIRVEMEVGMWRLRVGI